MYDNMKKLFLLGAMVCAHGFEIDRHRGAKVYFENDQVLWNRFKNRTE